MLLFLILWFSNCNFESDKSENIEAIVTEKHEEESLVASITQNQEDTISFLSPEDLEKYKTLEDDWQRIIFLMNLVEISQEENYFFKFNENSFDDVDTIASELSFSFLTITKQQVTELLYIFCKKEPNCQKEEMEKISTQLNDTKYFLGAEVFKTETSFHIFMMVYSDGETQQIYFQL